MTRPATTAKLILVSLTHIFLVYVVTTGVVAAQQLSSESTDNSVKLRVNLINLNISVLDPDGRFVRGLSKDNFEIYEDKMQQSIDHFTFEDLPISLGFVFDLSGSMKNKASRAREALRGFLEVCHPENEMFLVGFNDRPELLSEFTTNEAEIMNRAAFKPAQGSTALIDAVYMAIEKLKQGRHNRKVLVIISDGQDNASRYTDRELKRLVKESDISIFSIGTTAIWQYLSQEDIFGMKVLDDISTMTGGNAYFPRSFNEMKNVCTNIGIELRNQYSIAYMPTNANFDGKWRKLKIRLKGLKDGGYYALRTRNGYYARP